MTCIVGYIDDDSTVWMGGDSASVDEATSMTCVMDKVFSLQRKMLIGYAGSWRDMQLFKYSLKLPKHPEGISTHEYLCTVFVDEVLNLLGAQDRLAPNNENCCGTDILIGYMGDLFEMEPNFQVMNYDRNYHATGCTREIVMGSMYAMENQKISPRQKIKKALRASCEFSGWVKPPFTIKSLKYGGIK